MRIILGVSLALVFACLPVSIGVEGKNKHGKKKPKGGKNKGGSKNADSPGKKSPKEPEASGNALQLNPEPEASSSAGQGDAWSDETYFSNAEKKDPDSVACENYHKNQEDKIRHLIHQVENKQQATQEEGFVQHLRDLLAQLGKGSVTMVNDAALEIYSGADANVISSYFESHIQQANIVRITTIGADVINSLSEFPCDAGDQAWLLNGKEVSKYAGLKRMWKAEVQNGKDITLTLKSPLGTDVSHYEVLFLLAYNQKHIKSNAQAWREQGGDVFDEFHKMVEDAASQKPHVRLHRI